MSNESPMRFHAMDSLRGWMMLLGVVLHAACAYGALPMGEAWPFKDEHQSGLMDVILVAIHAFRMPAFFLVAGFFTCLLVARRGLGGMLDNRARRVGLPLVAGWVAFVPLTFAGFLEAAPSSVSPLSAELGWDALLSPVNLGHLWFLYYLLMFYVATELVAFGARRLPVRWVERLDLRLRALIASPWRALPLSGLTFTALVFMRTGGLDTSTSIVPDAAVFWAYGGFFAFGWALHRHRDLLSMLERRCVEQLILGILLLPIAFVLIGENLETLSATGEPHEAARIAAAAVSALNTWLLTFGVVGLFLRHQNQFSVGARYLSDASYWVYLAHLPVVVWCQTALAPLAMPALAKFGLTLAVATVATLASYQLWVRATVVGQFLNGRRYPRTLSADAPTSVAAEA